MTREVDGGLEIVELKMPKRQGATPKPATLNAIAAALSHDENHC